MFDWLNGRRLYNFIIANKLKRLLRRNFDKVVAPHIKSGLVSYEKVFGATSLYDIDEYYNRRVLVSFNSYFSNILCRALIQLTICITRAHLFIASMTSKFRWSF
jgi:hypothetical protein